MKKCLLLSLLLIYYPAFGQSSLGYKGISIPIVKSKSHLDSAPSCSDLSTTKKNIIYYDDLGPYPNRNRLNGGSDPNGFQDMVIVLGFGKKYSSKINLLGVGTSNRGAEDHDLLRQVVLKSGLIIPAWSEDQIIPRINFYAKCPQITTSNRLALATGGEWNKIDWAIANDISAVSNKVEAAGLTAYNVRDCSNGGSPCPYYDGNPFYGWIDALSNINQTNFSYVGRAHSFRDPLFREPYLPNTNFPISKLNQLYDNYISKALIGVKDERGQLITKPSKNSVYETAIFNDGPTGSRLKIADFLTVAKFIWPNDLDKIHKKEFIHPKIIEAVRSIL